MTLRGLADQAAAAVRAAGGYHVYDDLGYRTPESLDRHRPGSGQLVRHHESADRANLPERLLAASASPICARAIISFRWWCDCGSRSATKRKKFARSTFTARRTSRCRLPVLPGSKSKPSYALIPHYNQLRTVTVESYAPAGELSSRIVARARAALDAIKLPPGYRLEIAGEEKELKKGQDRDGKRDAGFSHTHRSRHDLAV